MKERCRCCFDRISHHSYNLNISAQRQRKSEVATKQKYVQSKRVPITNACTGHPGRSVSSSTTFCDVDPAKKPIWKCKCGLSNVSSQSHTRNTQSSCIRRRRRPGAINTASAVKWCRCLVCTRSEQITEGIKLRVIPKKYASCNCKKCKMCKRNRRNDIINCWCHKYLKKVKSKIEQEKTTAHPKINEDKKTDKHFTIRECSRSKVSNWCQKCLNKVDSKNGQKNSSKQLKKDIKQDQKQAKSKERIIDLQQTKSKPCCQKCIDKYKVERRKQDLKLAHQEQQRKKQQLEIDKLYKETRKQDQQIAKQEKQREEQQKQIDDLAKQKTKQDQFIVKLEKTSAEHQKQIEKQEKRKIKQSQQDERIKKQEQQKQQMNNLQQQIQQKKQMERELKHDDKQSNKQEQQREKQGQEIQKLKQHVTKLEQHLSKVQHQNKKQLQQIPKQNQQKSKQKQVTHILSSCTLCKSKSQQSIKTQRLHMSEVSESRKKSSNKKIDNNTLLCECPKSKSIFKTCSFKSCLSIFKTNTSRNITPIKSNRSNGKRSHLRRNKRRPGVVDTSCVVKRCRCILRSQSERLTSGIKICMIPAKLSNCDCKKCARCKANRKKRKDVICWCHKYFQKIDSETEPRKSIEQSKCKTDNKVNKKSAKVHKKRSDVQQINSKNVEKIIKKQDQDQRDKQGQGKRKREQKKGKKIQLQIQKMQEQIRELNNKITKQSQAKGEQVQQICKSKQCNQQKEVTQKQEQRIKMLQQNIVKLEQKILKLEQQKGYQQQPPKQTQKKKKLDQIKPSLVPMLAMKKLDQKERKQKRQITNITDTRETSSYKEVTNNVFCECPKIPRKNSIFKSCSLKSCLSIFKKNSRNYDVTRLKSNRSDRRQKRNTEPDAREICLCKKIMSDAVLCECVNQPNAKKCANKTCSFIFNLQKRKLEQQTLKKTKQERQTPKSLSFSLSKTQSQQSVTSPQIDTKSDSSRKSTSKKIKLREYPNKSDKKNNFKTCSLKSCLSILKGNTSRNVTLLKSNKSDGRRSNPRRHKRRPGVIDTSSAAKWCRALCTRSEQLTNGIKFQVVPNKIHECHATEYNKGINKRETQKDPVCWCHKYFQKANYNKDQKETIKLSKHRLNCVCKEYKNKKENDNNYIHLPAQSIETKIACGDVNNQMICNAMHRTCCRHCDHTNALKNKFDKTHTKNSSIANLRKTIKCLCNQYYDKVQEVRGKDNDKESNIDNNIPSKNKKSGLNDKNKDRTRAIGINNTDKISMKPQDAGIKINIETCNNKNCVQNENKIKTRTNEVTRESNIRSKPPDYNIHNAIKCKCNTKTENQHDQTGEPFFAVKLNSVDMSIINSTETLDKIKHLGKTVHYEGSCICPSHKHLIRKYKKEDNTPCEGGPCHRARNKNKGTNFTCKCLKKRILHCSDITCKETKNKRKIKKRKKFETGPLSVNPVPLFEVKLDSKNMNITNAKEITRNMYALEQARLEGDIICKAGVCKENVNNKDLKISCFCKREHNPIECNNTTCAQGTIKKRKQRCKLCTIFGNKLSTHGTSRNVKRKQDQSPCPCTTQPRLYDILKTTFSNNALISALSEKITSLQNLFKNSSIECANLKCESRKQKQQRNQNCLCKEKRRICDTLRTTFNNNAETSVLSENKPSIPNLFKTSSTVCINPKCTSRKQRQQLNKNVCSCGGKPRVCDSLRTTLAKLISLHNLCKNGSIKCSDTTCKQNLNKVKIVCTKPCMINKLSKTSKRKKETKTIDKKATSKQKEQGKKKEKGKDKEKGEKKVKGKDKEKGEHKVKRKNKEKDKAKEKMKKKEVKKEEKENNKEKDKEEKEKRKEKKKEEKEKKKAIEKEKKKDKKKGIEKEKKKEEIKRLQMEKGQKKNQEKEKKKEKDKENMEKERNKEKAKEEKEREKEEKEREKLKKAMEKKEKPMSEAKKRAEKEKMRKAELRKIKSKQLKDQKEMMKRQMSQKTKEKLMKSQKKAEMLKQKDQEYQRNLKNESRTADDLNRKEYLERKKHAQAMKKQFKSLQAQTKGKEETAQTSCCADFILGTFKFFFDIAKNAIVIVFRLIFTPKQSYIYMKMRAQNPRGTVQRVKQWTKDYIALKKLKMQNSIAGSENMSIVVDTFQDTGFYQAFLARKGKTKQERKDIERENNRRKLRNRKRDEGAVHGCRHALLTTLRKRPCLWVYHICPNFYPQCLSFLAFYHQFIELCLFCLAVMFWTPCLMAVEAVRFFVCCCLCTA